MNKSTKLLILTVAIISVVLIGIVARVTTGNLSSQAHRRQEHFQYVRDELGNIVLDYIEGNSEPPDSFDLALQTSTRRLRHRGDYFGRGIVYKKIDAQSFFFISAGPNNRIEMGRADDLVICYEHGRWFLGDSEYVKQAYDRILRARSGD